MKKLMLLLGLTISVQLMSQENGRTEGAVPNEVIIPDDNFRNALLANTSINTVDDGVITTEEAEAFTGELGVTDNPMTDATGIEAFVNITKLRFQRTGLTSLDVSNNTKLTTIIGNENSISTVTLGSLPNLTGLVLDNNELSSADFSGLPALELLWINDNLFTNFDLSSNTKLTGLKLYRNSDLATLDLSNQPDLLSLEIALCDFSTIDISANPELLFLSVSNNNISALDLSQSPKLETLYVSDNILTSLDLRVNSKLKSLWAKNNSLEFMDVSNGNNQAVTLFDITGNPNLTCVKVDNQVYSQSNWNLVDNGLTFTDTYCDINDPVYIPDANFKAALVDNVTINTNMDTEISYAEAEAFTGELQLVTLGINDLTGIEAFVELTGLIVNFNNLTEIDLSSNTKLELLYAVNNQLTSLDVTNNPSLQILSAVNNDLTSISFGEMTSLATLYLDGNEFTSLDISACPALLDFRANGNKLTSIDLSNATLVTGLRLSDNDLTVLNLSANTQVQTLTLSGNELITLDLSQNGEITILNIYGNNFSTIDLSAQTKLNFINFGYNDITTLDLSNNTLLQTCYVFGNDFEELDLGANTALTDVIVGENPVLKSVNIKNGNNAIITRFDGDQSPNLMCVQVDDIDFAENNWTEIDAHTGFSTDCNVVEFVDENFETTLLADNAINTNGDEYIQISEAEAVTGSLFLSVKGIADLTGIESFTNIVKLFVNNNNLTTVDISQNVKLTEFRIQNNPLNSLDVTSNTELIHLESGGSNLSSLDVSTLTKLEVLKTGYTSIGSIDLSNNTAISTLDLTNTNIENLDLSDHTALRYLYLEDNDLLSSLNVANGNNQQITSFWMQRNPLLSCITVDNPGYSETNWTRVDPGVVFSTDCSNDATDITAFSLTEQSNAADIDVSNHTVSILVALGTDLTNLTPTISVSNGATVSLGGAQDFTAPVTYTVHAEDGSTIQDWVVTVDIALSTKEFSTVSIHPNPTTDLLYVSGLNGQYRFDLVDISGRTLYQGQNDEQLSMAAYDKGMYFLKISADNGVSQVWKIIKD